MQYIAASIVVVSGAMLWAVGALLEFQAFSTPSATSLNRWPGQFAEWGGAAAVAAGIAIIVWAIARARHAQG
jgi:hypothetical protein